MIWATLQVPFLPMCSEPIVPNHEFHELRTELERAVKALGALNLDHRTRIRLLRDLRKLLAQADRLLAEEE